jgi:ectoine hydroxylase-related dioxygenase (phytanoyl-CoA dioxygenase family)
MQMCERSLSFRRLLYQEPILDIAEDLIGPNIQLFHDQALFKPAHHGGPIHPHQDNAYWRCLPATLVSCWLTLDDVDVDNGAMHLLPGSHLAAMGHERGDVLLDAGTPNPAESRVVPLPAGGALFHHCQTLHFTPPNRTDRQRRAFAIHFMTPGTRSPRGELPIGFSRPLLRGHM